MSYLEDDSSVDDVEDMLKQADRLSAAMHGKNGKPAAKPQPTKPVSVDSMEEMLKRAEKMAQEMKGEPLVHELDEQRQDGSAVVDPIDSMLAKAGNLAAQMRTSNPGSSVTSAKSLIVSTFDLPGPSNEEDLFTPRLTHTVSTDDGSDGIDTMLLKAELLSKTIRSAASGHIDTPELIRASDEILQRARAKQGVRALAAMVNSTSSTPELLARAKTILDAPLERVMSGDRTVDTHANSMDTDPICNMNEVPPSLLTRPPRPPTQRLAPPVTPSPKGTQFMFSPSDAADNQKESLPIENGGHLARAIEAIQSVPTKKAPDSPIMPKSVALHRCDSDDISSVGSGSFMRNMSASNLQQRGSPDRSRVFAGISGSVAESLDDDDDDNKGHSKMVSYAEDVAKQMADALEETLSCSSSVGMHLESPAQPRKLLTSPSPRFKMVKKVDADKEEMIRTELFQASLEMDRSHSSWERHNAVVLEPRDTTSSNDLLRRKRLDAKVKWETVHIPGSTDEDYAPMQDFRDCASLELGEMPANASSPKTRTMKRRKLIRVLVVGMLCLVVVWLASNWHSSSSVSTFVELPTWMKEAANRMVQESKATANRTIQVSKATANRMIQESKAAANRTIQVSKAAANQMVQESKAVANRTIQESKAAANRMIQESKAAANRMIQENKATANRMVQENKAPPKKTKATSSIQQDPPVEIKPKPTPAKKTKAAASAKRDPLVGKKAKPTPPKKTQPTVSVQRELPVVKTTPAAQVKQTTIKNTPRAVVDKKAKISVPADAVVTERVLTSLQNSLGDGNESVGTAPEMIEIPNRCFVPLGYVAFSKCRQITRKQPLFDSQAFVDSMLQ